MLQQPSLHSLPSTIPLSSIIIMDQHTTTTTTTTTISTPTPTPTPSSSIRKSSTQTFKSASTSLAATVTHGVTLPPPPQPPSNAYHHHHKPSVSISNPADLESTATKYTNFHQSLSQASYSSSSLHSASSATSASSTTTSDAIDNEDASKQQQHQQQQQQELKMCTRAAFSLGGSSSLGSSSYSSSFASSSAASNPGLSEHMSHQKQQQQQQQQQHHHHHHHEHPHRSQQLYQPYQQQYNNHQSTAYLTPRKSTSSMNASYAPIAVTPTQQQSPTIPTNTPSSFQTSQAITIGHRATTSFSSSSPSVTSSLSQSIPITMIPPSSIPANPLISVSPSKLEDPETAAYQPSLRSSSTSLHLQQQHQQQQQQRGMIYTVGFNVNSGVGSAGSDTGPATTPQNGIPEHQLPPPVVITSPGSAQVRIFRCSLRFPSCN
jgi:hypothetical protein